MSARFTVKVGAGAILIALVVGLFACQSKQDTGRVGPPKSFSGEIKTLADFEGSRFFQKYGLKKRDEWALRDGSYNNVYDARSIPDLTFEVQTRSDQVTGLGVSFYRRDRLRHDDLTFVYDLLDSLDPQTKRDAQLENHIQANIGKRVFQIKEAAPYEFGKFRVYSGKVGAEEIVSIERALVAN